jgi:hypothetical protein
MTLKEVKDALNKFFGDTSRSPEKTREGLEDLVCELEVMLDALKSDLRR